MCGRYVLSLRPSVVRQRLADQDMYADEVADDDDDRVRQTYNFAPGYHGLIYRAATSDRGAVEDENSGDGHEQSQEPSPKRRKVVPASTSQHTVDGLATKETKYKLQAARWGLIPFWTKRPPDYASQMRTINCRDDSLLENRGMWNTMKQRKRCIVVAEGFYEWLKKNNGKEKIPHFIKRKDGELMCFAGLWDMVKYDGSEEKLYTYTIITTDSNAQLKFLHDRMPVIFEPGSPEMKAWLDPNNIGWSKELQSMLKPFRSELEIYPVDKAVGKVGNNNPSFVIPIDSKENKKNIANFFGNQAAASQEKNKTDLNCKEDESRATTDRAESTEDNAPLPEPKDELEKALKHNKIGDSDIIKSADEATDRDIKKEQDIIDDNALLKRSRKSSVKLESDDRPADTPSPVKKPADVLSPVKRSKRQTPSSERKARNATTNNTQEKTPTKDGNARITTFFGK